MHCFLLAGGFATRLWPLTERRPKPLLPLAGKPMLSHLVEKIPSDLPVTVSTNATFEEEFREWMTTQNRSIDLVIEDTRKDDQKLGALGALAQWITANSIKDDLFILTGDNYLGFSLNDFLQSYRGNPLLAAHDIGDLSKASAFGTVVAEQSEQNFRRVLSFEEKPLHPRSTLVSAGCMILPSRALSILAEYAKGHPDNIGSIFEEYLRQHLTVECFVFTEPWIDIGSFTSYLDAHRFLVDGHTLTDPSSSLTQTHTSGSVAIGENCHVSNSQLTDCMIFDNCTIENCVLRDCVIDDNCTLQGIDLTGKMIRAGTKLLVE